MALGFLNPESLLVLGQTIKKKRESLGLTQESLAFKSGYIDKIIRLIEHGGRTKIHTLKDVCKALGLPEDTYNVSDYIISSERYGSYNFNHYADYVGVYFGFRHSLVNQTGFLRTVYEILWSEKKRCLQFFEDHRYVSKSGRLVDFNQHGDIYISNEVGLLHLLSRVNGAIRLITLSKLRRDDNLLEGVVLTQLRNAHYYSPAASPIYLQKVEGITNRSELSSFIGPISPTDEVYSTVAACIEEVEREVVRMAPMSPIDPKVTRISPRAGKSHC